LIFRHPASSTLSINDSFELHLRYLDGIGEQSSQVLYFTADKRGNFEFSSESLA